MPDEHDSISLVKKDKDEDYGSTAEQQDSTEEWELNAVYEKIGLGPAQYLCWILVGLVGYSDYAELTVISVTMPDLRCEWGLTSTFEAAITISLFGSYAFFAMTFGKVSDLYGRKTVIVWSTLFLILAAVGAALSPNKWVFLGTRIVTGASIGINVSCTVCYASEICENNYRAIGISIMVFSGFAGQIAVNLIAWLSLNEIGWRWLIVLVSIPAVPVLVLLLILPESPRYLCVSGQKYRAMSAVRFMAKTNSKELPADLSMYCYQNEELGSYKMLLSPPHLRHTLALSLIYHMNIFLEYGLIIFLPLMFSSDFCGAKTAASPHNCELLSQQDLLKLTFTSIASIIGVCLALFLATKVGRLAPLRVANGIQIFTLAALYICVNNTVTFATASLVKFVEPIINTLLWIIIPECFPTSIRSTATGFINGWGKIGGLLGTGMVYLLFYVDPNAVLGLFLASSVVGFLGTLILDKETRDVMLQET